MENKGNIWIKIITLIISVILVCIVMLSFNSGINTKSEYISKYKNLDDLKYSVTFEILYPTFMYEEKDLMISDVLGQIVEVRNNNFIFKASEFVDNNADVLGIYDKLPEDFKYIFEENDEGLTYFRYRCSGKQTLLNWVRHNTAYGLILDKVISIEEAQNILNITEYKLIEYTESNSDTEINKESNENYEIIQGIKFKIPDELNSIEKLAITNEAVVYTINSKALLIVVYNNIDKYLETYGTDVKIKEFENIYFLYKSIDIISDEEKADEEYYTGILKISEIINSIDTVGEQVTQVENQNNTLIDNEHFILKDNKQGLLDITYKSDKYGVILIQNTSKSNSKEYKYILEPGEYNTIALTDGAGTYELKLHNVEELKQGIVTILNTYEGINVELSTEFENQVFKNSTTLVDFENNKDIIDKIFHNTNDIDEIYNYFKDMGYNYTLSDKISNGEITKYKVNIANTLQEQRGICYDIATSMTTVLRYKGYTAQMVYGYISNTYHSWVRVLVDNKWVAYDPTLGKTSYNDDMSMYIIDEYH